MSEVVFDIRDWVAGTEHSHCTGMPEAMHGMDVFETFRAQGALEVFLAESMDAVSGKFLTALIDKESVSI